MMQAMSGSASADRLYREAALWLVGARDVEPLVRAACDAVVTGTDGPAVSQLSALSVHAPPADIETEEVIYAAMEEVGRPLPPRDTDEARCVAASAMAQETLDQRMPPRELVRWIHRAIGHDGPERLRDLVMLDDVYDSLPYIAESEADIDRRVLAAARQLIAAQTNEL